MDRLYANFEVALGDEFIVMLGQTSRLLPYTNGTEEILACAITVRDLGCYLLVFAKDNEYIELTNEL